MDTQAIYEIRLAGQVSQTWATLWFDGFNLRYIESGETILTGVIVDQAALHGVLIRIRDLGIPLVSVNRVEDSVQPSACNS